MSVLAIDTASIFEPLLYPSRYKGAHGGRGSGKSHFFAESAVERCIIQRGCRVLCGREVQKSLAESAKRLVEDKIKALQAPGFRILNDRTETPGGGVIVYQGLQEHTADTIKSYEGFDVFWIEEAHKLKQRSLDILRPTLRKPNSEIWFSWNPFRKSDPVDALMRGSNARELGAVVVEANWRDNPWFPDVLKAERGFDQKHSPDTYDHVWEGAYATVVKGAYYAEGLALARKEGRICRLTPDPLLKIRSFHDIGGAGDHADAYSIWIAQFVGKEIHILDHYSSEGQTLAYHVAWMRDHGYERASIQLPHDGVNANNVTGKRYADHWKDAGFDVPEPIPNQGAGAAMMRIEAGRRLFPRIWFNEATTEVGRESIGAYHEKRHEQLEVGVGPLHDWASHDADAFGLMCIAYEPPKPPREPRQQRTQYEADAQSTAWMQA